MTVMEVDIYSVYRLIVGLSYARGRLSDRPRVRLSVCPSVRLSHAGIDSKLITAGSCGFHLQVAQGLQFFMPHFVPLARVSNESETGINGEKMQIFDQ